VKFVARLSLPALDCKLSRGRCLSFHQKANHENLAKFVPFRYIKRLLEEPQGVAECQITAGGGRLKILDLAYFLGPAKMGAFERAREVKCGKSGVTGLCAPSAQNCLKLGRLN
jgi:hypothetical protein